MFNLHFWRGIFLLGPLACSAGIVYTVFRGHRQKDKRLKLRIACVMLLAVALACIYAFAPGWYKPNTGSVWVTTEVSTDKTGFAYWRVVAFEPIFRLSPLIFIGLGSVFTAIALCFPRKAKR